jgi:hypothetical protein
MGRHRISRQDELADIFNTLFLFFCSHLKKKNIIIKMRDWIKCLKLLLNLKKKKKRETRKRNVEGKKSTLTNSLTDTHPKPTVAASVSKLAHKHALSQNHATRSLAIAPLKTRLTPRDSRCGSRRDPNRLALLPKSECTSRSPKTQAWPIDAIANPT